MELNRIRTQALSKKIKEADSLSSFISVSMILLAFLVALNATRNTQVSDISTSSSQQTMSEGQFRNDNGDPLKQLLLREKISLAALFQGETASLSSSSYPLAKALTNLIKDTGISSILVINASDSQPSAIELSLKRATVLHRLLLDSGLPQEVFSIVTKTSADEKENYLTILFKEGYFDE